MEKKRKHYKTVDRCRVCGSKRLTPVVAFKPQYIASTFVKTNRNNPKAKIKIPMTLMLCKKCGLVQLKETVIPDLLYEEYFYRSNISNTMNRDLRDVVADVMNRITLKKGDEVLDLVCRL